VGGDIIMFVAGIIGLGFKGNGSKANPKIKPILMIWSPASEFGNYWKLLI
jgi:hypothetical protein